MPTEKKIINIKYLQDRIEQLQLELDNRELKIKSTYQQFSVNLQPENLIGEVTQQVGKTTGLNKLLINVALGVGVAYVSKTAIQKTFYNYLDKWGNKHPESWLTKGISFIKNVAPIGSLIFPFLRDKI